MSRPCNPNSDLKRLWQFLLPDTPFPQCGTPAEVGATERVEGLEKPPAGAEPTVADRKAQQDLKA